MGGVRGSVRTVIAAVLLGLAMVWLAACGGGDGRQGWAAVEGREFRSSAVTGRVLVEGTQIALEFRDGDIRARAGCNILAAPYAVRDAVLVVAGGTMSSTEMGCTPDRHAQDEWLASFLTSAPQVELGGDTLTLSLPGTRIVLLDRVIADPDRPLRGTLWRVDTVLAGDTARSVADPSGVQLDFRDGTLTVTSAGCTSAVVSYQREGDELRFGTLTVDAIGCADPWQPTVDVLRAGTVRLTIVASRLTLRAGSAGLAATGT